MPGRAPAGQLGARHGRSVRESSPERPRWDQCAGGPASMSRPETCARRSPGFARVHAESRAPARLTLATPLRTAACASRNARVARSRDAWAFKSSRWTHRQLPFRLFPPSTETNPHGNQSENPNRVYPPRVPPSHVPRTSPFLSIAATAISRFRRRAASAARVLAFGAERDALAHQTPRHSRPGPREGAAHARASAFGRREREGLAEAVKGRVCGGTRPSADEIRREPRASWRRFRRVSGRRPGGVCAYLDRGGSTPTTDLARWRRASPTPRPLSGSRA